MALKLKILPLYLLLGAFITNLCGFVPSELCAQTTVSSAMEDMPVVELSGQKFWFYDVKKDESLYGVAKKLGWDEGVLRQYNPIVAGKPVKGQRLFYPQDPKYIQSGLPEVPAITQEQMQVTHTVAKGETLGQIAVDYVTSVEEIFRINPKLTPENFAPGTVLKINQGSSNDKVVKQLQTSTYVGAFVPYHVNKNDTWETIAKRNDRPLEMLRAVNAGVGELSKGKWVSIPSQNTYSISTQVLQNDPRESSAEGVQAIYDELQQVIALQRPMQVLFLLSDPQGKMDLEAARGFILGVDELKDSGLKINVKMETLFRALKNLETLAAGADLIVTTCDKNFPKSLADYSNTNDVVTVNLFDMKSNLVDGYPFLVNILENSERFNSGSAAKLAEIAEGKKIIVVAANDAIKDDVMLQKLLASGKFDALTLLPEEFMEYELTPGGDYAIYLTSTKDDLEQQLKHIAEMRENVPSAQVTTIGRPALILYVSNNADLYGKANLYVPSRFYQDENSYEVRNLQRKYLDSYKFEAAKSFPMYSTVGYDTAVWFIPNVKRHGAELEEVPYSNSSLQSPFILERNFAGAALENRASYIVHFTEYGPKLILVEAEQ